MDKFFKAIKDATTEGLVFIHLLTSVLYTVICIFISKILFLPTDIIYIIGRSTMGLNRSVYYMLFFFSLLGCLFSHHFLESIFLQIVLFLASVTLFYVAINKKIGHPSL